jgi:hypothetical protein
VTKAKTPPPKPTRLDNFGAKSNIGRGRPKGSVNKAPKLIKDMIRESLDRAGGADYLLKCARTNKSAYLTMITRLIPGDLLAHAADAAPEVHVSFTVAEVKAEDF